MSDRVTERHYGGRSSRPEKRGNRRKTEEARLEDTRREEPAFDEPRFEAVRPEDTRRDAMRGNESGRTRVRATRVRARRSPARRARAGEPSGEACRGSRSPSLATLDSLGIGRARARDRAGAVRFVVGGQCRCAQAEARGDKGEAIRNYLHATRMYVPGSPFVARALDGLEAIAQAAGEGDIATERQALEAVRSGLLARAHSTAPRRSFVGGRSSIGRHLRADRGSSGGPGGYAGRAGEARHAARLAVRPGPSPVASVMALGGLLLWLGAALLFIRRGVDRMMRLQRSWALTAGVAFSVGFTLLLLGLRFA